MYGLSVSCAFLCGSTQTHKDDFEGLDGKREFIRWCKDPKEGPPNGLGNNDWVCERLWAKVSAEQQLTDRAKFQESLARDVEKTKSWRVERAEYVEKRKNQLQGAKEKRRSGLTRTRVSTQKYSDNQLIRDDDFWPMHKYRKKIGSVDAPKIVHWATSARKWALTRA